MYLLGCEWVKFVHFCWIVVHFMLNLCSFMLVIRSYLVHVCVYVCVCTLCISVQYCVVQFGSLVLGVPASSSVPGLCSHYSCAPQFILKIAPEGVQICFGNSTNRLCAYVFKLFCSPEQKRKISRHKLCAVLQKVAH